MAAANDPLLTEVLSWKRDLYSDALCEVSFIRFFFPKWFFIINFESVISCTDCKGL